MPRARRHWLAGILLCGVLASATPARAQFPYSTSVGNIQPQLWLPTGVVKVKAVMAFADWLLATGWASADDFRALATRLEAGVMLVKGGDLFATYPGRCASGEFNNVPMALTALAKTTMHPELATVPIIGVGHSHGGDYWNWFNACHPDRMAMVFVHASGGVNYSAAALKVPVFYTLGTQDLIERGSGKPRAGMFANRGKGAPMTLVIGVGGHDTQFSAGEYDIVTQIIEGIFKLRVPADADAAKGPVKLYDIVEGEGSWLGDLYTKEISAYPDFKGNKALTAYLPNAQLAMAWKTNGPGLPTSVMLPTGNCGWCGNPKDEPPAMPGATPPPGGPDPGTPGMDAGTTPPPPADDAGATTPPSPTMTQPDAAAGPSTTPPPKTTPPGSDDSPDTTLPPRKPAAAGGCALGGISGSAASPIWLLGLAVWLGCARRSRR